ncbi:hypothetical protein R1sor_026571 [Riccia sorocarpa]|uniref:Uncharacterized protein n=1 Tax=Riccia sorocarpa TaxID=122646 RepID=A0ABD3GBS5_9MARC
MWFSTVLGSTWGAATIETTADFCVDEYGRCFPIVNKRQPPTPVSAKRQPDVGASNGGSQEDKKIKRKPSSVMGKAKAPAEVKLAESAPGVFQKENLNAGECHHTELNSGIKTVEEGDDQVTEQELFEEKEVGKEFFALLEEEDRVNENKDRLLQDYDDQFKGIIQLVQDQRENLRSRLTDVQHSAKLTPKGKEVETRLKDLRLAAKDKYCKLIKAEKEKRLKTEADLRFEKDRHSKLCADLQSEKAKCAKLETEVQFEKTKRQSELLETTRLKGDLQSERNKREKLESDLMSEEVKRLKFAVDIASEKARIMLLEGDAKSHEAEHVKVQEEMELERLKRLKLERDIQSEKEKRLKLEEDFRLSEQKLEEYYHSHFVDARKFLAFSATVCQLKDVLWLMSNF